MRGGGGGFAGSLFSLLAGGGGGGMSLRHIKKEEQTTTLWRISKGTSGCEWKKTCGVLRGEARGEGERVLNRTGGTWAGNQVRSSISASAERGARGGCLWRYGGSASKNCNKNESSNGCVLSLNILNFLSDTAERQTAGVRVECDSYTFRAVRSSKICFFCTTAVKDT